MPPNKSVISPELVGRADDLAQLEVLLQQSMQGSGQTALVAAEAGLGKSRLIDELAKRAGRHGASLILKGNCFETDQALPYAPLIDLLRTFYSSLAPHELAGKFGESATGLSKILPELAAADRDSDDARKDEPEQEKHRLFQALAQFLIARAKGGLIIIIEDLHWCDDTSLEFLLHLSRRAAQHAIFLLMTYRSDEIQPGLTHFLSELDRERRATEIALRPLSEAEVDLMLRAIFDLNRPIRAEFMDVLHPLTEGNPFFIEEVLKSLIVSGEIYYADGSWDRQPIDRLNIPRSVHDAVHRRVEQLTPAAKELLVTAAAIGQRFDFQLIQQLTGRGEKELLPLLKELIAVQLIVEEARDRFVLRHALTREAIYSQLLGRERAGLHLRIGQAMEHLSVNEAEDRYAGLAYHFYEANDWQKAMEYSLQAAENAQGLYAPRAAAEHFTHAFEAANQLGITPAANLFRQRGLAFERLGDFEAARADYESALQTAHEAGDANAEWQSLLDLGALWAGRDYSETGKYFVRANELAQQLADPRLIAHSLNRLGNWNVNLGLLTEGLEDHQRALDLFETLGDSKGIAQTQDLLGMANYIHGDLVKSEGHYEQAVELFRSLKDRHGLASSLASMMLNSSSLQSAMGALADTDPELAAQRGEEALQIARDTGWRSGEAYALIILSNYFGVRGDFTKGIDLALNGLAIAEEIGHNQWTTYARYGLGLLYLDALALPQAQDQFERALDLANRIGSSWWIANVSGWLSLAYLAQHEHNLASAALRSAIGPAIESASHPIAEVRALTLGQRMCWYAGARLALTRNEPQRALDIVEQLIASSAHAAGDAVISRLWHVRGEALSALERPAEAAEALSAARDDAQRRQELPLLWRIQDSLARVYQSSAETEKAEEALAASQETLGVLADNIQQAAMRENFSSSALASLPNMRARSARQLAKKEFGGLTAREREVAAMISQGKSNREAAAALYVTERTVETHVGNILSKLGFSSRAQIAAWAVESGLTAQAKERGVV